MHEPRSRRRGQMLAWPLMLLTGCATGQMPLQQSDAKAPPLPVEASQPAPQALCLPTCSEGLRRLLDSLLQPQTNAAQQAMPASGPMKL